MMSDGSKLLVIGLKASGKTSYLAALWHLMEAGELPAMFQVARLQPNRKYLNRIRNSWLSFEDVGRTPMREETLSLNLRSSESGGTIEITIPDLSGELFRQQWDMRHATSKYAEFTAAISGVFLFIHSASIKRPARIPGKVPPVDGVKQELKIWSSEHASTQVKLVELLQFVTWLRRSEESLRISVIISAWDAVRGSISPAFWIEQRLPLLHQYLVANSERQPFRVFGVSALGGDLETDIESLKQESVPSRRIKVMDDSLRVDHDLTAPLRFLILPFDQVQEKHQ